MTDDICPGAWAFLIHSWCFFFWNFCFYRKFQKTPKGTYFRYLKIQIWKDFLHVTSVWVGYVPFGVRWSCLIAKESCSSSYNRYRISGLCTIARCCRIWIGFLNLEDLDSGMSLVYINQWKLGQSIILTWIFACSDAWKNKGTYSLKWCFFHGDESHGTMLFKNHQKSQFKFRNDFQITTQLGSTRNKDLYQHLPKGAVWNPEGWCIIHSAPLGRSRWYYNMIKWSVGKQIPAIPADWTWKIPQISQPSKVEFVLNKWWCFALLTTPRNLGLIKHITKKTDDHRRNSLTFHPPFRVRVGLTKCRPLKRLLFTSNPLS